jgi:hypothetical protein
MSQTENKESNPKENEEPQEVYQIPDAFHANVLDLIAFCKSVFKRIEESGAKLEVGSGTLNIAYTFCKSQSPESIIRGFISRSKDNWIECADKDEEKLLPNLKALFSGIPESYINSILSVIKLKNDDGVLYVTPEDRDSIWDFLNELICLSIIFIHEQRAWCILSPEKNGYSKKYEKTISVKKMAAIFKVKIDYSVEEEIDEVEEQE